MMMKDSHKIPKSILDHFLAKHLSISLLLFFIHLLNPNISSYFISLSFFFSFFHPFLSQIRVRYFYENFSRYSFFCTCTHMYRGIWLWVIFFLCHMWWDYLCVLSNLLYYKIRNIAMCPLHILYAACLKELRDMKENNMWCFFAQKSCCLQS